MAKAPKTKAVIVTPDNASQSASPKQTEADTGANLEPIDLWQREIAEAKKRFEPWWDQSKAIIERYRDDRKTDSSPQAGKGSDERRYNVLWSITETMKPLIYNRPPTPFLNRRHNDGDPVARDASMLIERGLNFCIDTDELHEALMEARDDYLLTSRGTIWFKYSPFLKLRESEIRTYVDETPDEDMKGVDKDSIKADDAGRNYFHEKYEEKVYEECNVEHVPYNDFLHGVASKWSFVPWVARRVPMTRKELIARFGDKIGSIVPLTLKPRSEVSAVSRNESDEDKSMFGKAEVWEIWNKTTRKVMWLSPSLKETFLDTKDDILDLDNFFPCPRPVYGTKTNDSLVPVPDYKLWQDVAMELDEVTYRIALLTKAIRVVGVYDKSAGDVLKRVVTHTRENDMIPVDNWALFAERGGLRGSVEFIDISVIAGVLEKLMQARESLKQELYDITGMADIVRGATDPRETATAQSTKAGFANKRLSARQDSLSRMARESMEIMAEIICKHYSKDMIRQITSADEVLVSTNTSLFDVLRFESALDLMRNDPLRRFRIRIDEKNLAMVDYAEDRQDRIAFLQSVSQFLTSALPMVQQYPQTGVLMGELLMFGVRGFNSARSTEAAIDDAIKKLISTPPPAPQQQPQGKNPEEIQIEKQKNQIAMGHLQLAQQKHTDNMSQADTDHQLKAAELQQHASRAQNDDDIRKAKLSLDAASKDKALAIQSNQVETTAHLEQAKIYRDLQNDHHSIVQAFAKPKQTPTKVA